MCLLLDVDDWKRALWVEDRVSDLCTQSRSPVFLCSPRSEGGGGLCNSEAHFDRSFFRHMKGRTPSAEDESDIERTCVARESLILTTRRSSDELCLCAYPRESHRGPATHTHTHTQLYMTALNASLAVPVCRWFHSLTACIVLGSFSRGYSFLFFLVLLESRVNILK